MCDIGYRSRAAKIRIFSPKFLKLEDSMFKYPLSILLLFLLSCGSKSGIQIKGTVELEKPENIKFSEIIVKKDNTQIVDLKLVSPDFKLDLEPNSIYTLTVAAPEHETLETVLFTSSENETVHINLAKAQHLILFPPFLIGSFNGYNPQQAMQMREAENGTFIAQVPVQNGEVRYQVMGVTPDQRPVVGTKQDTFDYFDAGYFESIIYSNEPVVDIIFTPDTTPAKTVSALHSSSAFIQANADTYKLLANNRSALTAAYIQQYMSQSETINIDWEALAAPIKSKLSQASDINEKGIALIGWLDLKLNEYPGETSANIENIVMELGPENSLWSLNTYAVFQAMDYVQDASKKLEFLKEMSAKHANAGIREASTYHGFVVADEVLNSEMRTHFYNKLLADFPQSQFVEYAKYQYNPQNKVQSGTIAPSFSVASLDGKATFSNSQFAGKYIMLDFWATWCGPCLQEMDTLHDVYKEFKSDKFEILSLSFDESADDVKSFRKDRYPMPWLHTFVDGGFQNELAQRYEVSGIPKPILINPEGKIVAMGVQLRGPSLRKTLARFLN